MPLKQLCQITGDEELIAAGRKLSHSSTISFNIGLRGAVRPEFRDVHWIYVPDRDIPFYRVGFYSNISRGRVHPGTARFTWRSACPPNRQIARLGEGLAASGIALA